MKDKLLGYPQAFDHPVTVWICACIVALLVVVPAVILVATRLRSTDAAGRKELWLRYASWLVLAPLLCGPILLGAFWTMLVFFALALFGYREFARVTGSAGEKLVAAVVMAGTGLLFFAAVDHWYGLFVAAVPLVVGALLIAGLLQDRPQGYLRRVALGVLGFVLCGVSLGHLAYFGNDANYRPILLLLIVGIQLNDVFAFCCGKLFGRRKLIPRTSPNKTWGGSIGATALTTALVAGVGHFVFRDTALDRMPHLIGFGLLVSVLGQLGDLVVSSIKRDVGIKDTGSLIPGHGGLLDRFDSTLLVAPAAFHYVGYFLGVGLDQPVRILTG